MKILLTGATGFVGREILEQCIAHNYINRIVVLTRKSIDQKYFSGKGGDKVVEILHENFEEYPDSLMNRLREEGVEGCIWALGGKIESAAKLEEAQRVGINYPVQAAEALAKKIATTLSPSDMPKKKFPFRFVFLSSWGAEQNQFRTLWIWSDSRKLKGAAEKGLFDVAEGSEEIMGHKCFEVLSLRPGGVLAKSESAGTLLWEAAVPSVTVDRLAKCAIKTVLEGSGVPDKKILENVDCLGPDWANINTLSI